MRKMRFFTPIIFLAIVAGFSAIVMLLWNWLMPTIFGLVAISFWQALGILILCRLLFGGFRGKGHRGGMHGMHWRNHLREKWMKMTPEQREEFINRRRKHFSRGGFFCRPDFDPFATGEDTPKEHE